MNQTKLYIENQEVELNDDVQFAITKQFEDITNPTVIINDWSKTVEIPATQKNDELFGHIYNADKIVVEESEPSVLVKKYQNIIKYTQVMPSSTYFTSTVSMGDYEVKVYCKGKSGVEGSVSNISFVQGYQSSSSSSYNVQNSKNILTIKKTGTYRVTYTPRAASGTTSADNCIGLTGNWGGTSYPYFVFGVYQYLPVFAINQTVYLTIDVTKLTLGYFADYEIEFTLKANAVGFDEYESKNFGVYFDPYKKMDFRLEWNDNVIMTGYAKMTEIVRKDTNTTYNITLNGTLGKLFQEYKKITFDKSTVSDPLTSGDTAQYLINGASYYQQVMKKEIVYDTWVYNRNNTHTDISDAEPLEIVTFTPSNAFIDDFDHKGYIYNNGTKEINATFEGALPASFLTETGIKPATAIGDGLKPRDIAEFRSYNQQTFYWWDMYWQIFQKKAEDLCGYKWVMDPVWFNKDNPYWRRWLMKAKNFPVKPEVTEDSTYEVRWVITMNNVDSHYTSQGWTKVTNSLWFWDFGWTDDETARPSTEDWKTPVYGNLQPIRIPESRGVHNSEDITSSFNDYYTNDGCIYVEPYQTVRIKIPSEFGIEVPTFASDVDCKIADGNYLTITYNATDIDSSESLATVTDIFNNSNTSFKKYTDLAGSKNWISRLSSDSYLTVKNYNSNRRRFRIGVVIQQHLLNSTYESLYIVKRGAIWYSRRDYLSGYSSSTGYPGILRNPTMFIVPKRFWELGDIPTVYSYDAIDTRTIETTNNRRSYSSFDYNDLWDTEYNPFDMILNYCKMFHIGVYVDDTEKTVTFRPISRYFYDGVREGFLDWGTKVDYNKDFKVEPISWDSKYIKFNYTPKDISEEELYKSTYGVNYGEKRIKTEYNFNTDTKDLFSEGITPTLPYTPFVNSWENLCPSGSTTTPKIVYILPAEIYADDKDSDNKRVNTFGSFAISDGVQPFDISSTLRGVIITDDTDLEITTDKFCYNQTQSSATTIQVPKYHRVNNVFANGYYNNYTTFAVPSAIYKYTEEESDQPYGVYDLLWSDYISERYNKNNKKVTCYVNMTVEDYIGFEFNRFIKLDNQLYMVNKICDFDFNSDESTKVEMITVQDPRGYYIDNFDVISMLGVLSVYVTGSNIHAKTKGYMYDTITATLDGTVALDCSFTDGVIVSPVPSGTASGTHTVEYVIQMKNRTTTQSAEITI